jgi:hypothetical protein
MNPIDEQVSLLNELSQLMLLSVDSEYDSLSCIFEYETADDGSIRVGSRFSYICNGERVSAALIYPESSTVVTIVPKLHSIMSEHTGGNWKSFTLNINEKGEAKTKFEY